MRIPFSGGLAHSREKNELPCGEDGATISAQNRLSDRAQTPSLKLFYATSLSALAWILSCSLQAYPHPSSPEVRHVKIDALLAQRVGLEREIGQVG